MRQNGMSTASSSSSSSSSAAQQQQQKQPAADFSFLNGAASRKRPLAADGKDSAGEKKHKVAAKKTTDLGAFAGLRRLWSGKRPVAVKLKGFDLNMAIGFAGQDAPAWIANREFAQNWADAMAQRMHGAGCSCGVCG